VNQSLPVQDVEKVMAIFMVVFCSSITGVVSDAIGAYFRRPNGHILGDQIQPVTSISGRVKMGQLVFRK
jgi:hypothetical protein